MGLRFWILTLTPLLTLLSYTVLLIIVAQRARRHLLYRLFGLYLLAMLIWSLGSAMMRLDPWHILFWNRVLAAGAVLMPFAFFAFVQAFLGERRVHWLRVGLVVLVGLETAVALGLMTTEARLLEGGLLEVEPGPAVVVNGAYWVFFVGIATWHLVRAYRQTRNPILRNRIRYPLLGVVFVLLGGATNMVAALGAWPIDHAANLINALLLTYAIFRHQLVDITLVVRRGLFYSVPTAIIGIGYFLIILAATNLFRAFAGPQLLLLSLVVAAAAAVAAQPLRERAQHWIDRLFFREKYDASVMLQQLSRTATSVLDLNRLTSMILDGITNTMHIERAAFFLKQSEGGEFRLIAHRGLEPDTDMRLRNDHPLVDRLSRQEHALSRHETGMVPQFKALWGQELEDLQRLTAELCIPLKAKGDLVGILTVGPKRSEEAYSQDDQLTLTTLANQMVTALENARLHEETRRRYRELALLNRVIAASATSPEIEPLLKTVCRELPAALGELEATAILLNEDNTKATIVFDESSLRSEVHGQSAGLVGLLADGGFPSEDRTVLVESHRTLQYLLQYGSPLLMDDAWTDPYLAPIVESVRQCGISSLLSLPLFVEREVIGLLCLTTTNPRPYTADEVDLARRVADQISGALARVHLAETQQRLSTAVEQAAEAVMITDTDGTILYVNPAFEQLSGYERSALTGHSHSILRSGAHKDAIVGHLGRTIAAGQAWQGRLVDKKKDGTSYIGDMTVTPVRNQGGEIVNYVVTIRDVTREIQLERQFHQSQKMEALGRLAGGIAHDFNNLLTVIQLSSRLLQKNMSPQDSLRDHVQRIEEAGERAAKLTKQLLSFSRGGVFELRVVSLNQLVSDLGKMLQRILGEDVNLVVTLAEELWPVRVDPSQMEQVILNLAVNARDAMPQGGTLRIETANAVLDKVHTARHADAQPGEHVMLAVSDTGVGMGDEVKAHLFEPFFTTKERGQGTGLGLATVFGIVSQSEGHIRVQSDVERGTTFTVYLPRAKEAEAETTSDLVPIGTVGGTETILVVEDEARVRELTVHSLETQGYRVLAASNGLEALQVSKEHDGPIQLLLTDVVMPQMDSRELVKELQAERPEIRVLYMSGYTDRPLVKQAASDPGIAFLPKPFTLEALTQKVRSVLELGT